MIIGNLKMNLSITEIDQYLDDIKEIKDDNFIIAPSFIYLNKFHGHVSCGQNCFYQNEGAYTGEVSPKQLKALGVDYVIIGHSERRQLFGETNEIIHQKIKGALANNLKVIFCIGDTLEEYQNKQTISALKKQLLIGLKDVEKNNIIIAYEPVWAIGSGLVPTNQEIMTAASCIQKILHTDANCTLPILYGGSVNLENIEKLNTIDNIDGFLVGTAAKEAKILKEIYNKTR